MKKLSSFRNALVIILLFASLSMGEVLMDNAFEEATSNSGSTSRSNAAATTYNYVADDFTPTEDSIIREITIWIFDLGTNEYDPTDVVVEFYMDDNGNGPSSSTLLGTMSVPYADVTMTDIGEQVLGYDVYRCDVTLPDDGFTVRESRGRHWIRITPVYYRSNDRWYQVYRNWESEDGAELYLKRNYTDWTITDKESFMLIESEDILSEIHHYKTTIVEETTWGQIKAM